MAATRISPFAILFFLLLSVPLLEIYLLISVGRMIGAGSTVLVVIVTAVLGTWLLRLQGLQTFSRMQSASQAGKLPAVELVEGVILLACGVALLTPGFFTDAIGFIALVPAIRRRAAEGLLRHFLNRPDLHVNVHPVGSHSNTIEGTYRRED
jgi:UPF0716 protein FxsA